MAMLPSELRSRLKGPIAFPVTPFLPDLRLDIPGLRRNVEMLLEHRFAAIVAAGGTGELYSLTPAEHLEVVRATVEISAGRIPVIAGTGFSATLGETLAVQACSAGADGILAFPPYYPNADEQGLFNYYRTLAGATPLGLLIYSRDWFHPGPTFVERLATLETLIAWKEGQADVRRLQILMSALGERLEWIGGAGDDMVPAYYATGVRGYTSSVSNVAPGLAVALHDHAAGGRADALRPLMDKLIVPLYALRGRRRGYEVSVMKALMDLLGLAGGPVRPPLPEVQADDLPLVRQLVPGFRNWHISRSN